MASNFAINASGDLVTNTPVNLLLNTNGSNDQELTILVQGTVRNTINPGGTIANAATAAWYNSSSITKPGYTATGLAPLITVPQVFSVAKSIGAQGPPRRSAKLVSYRLDTTVIEGTTLSLSWVDTLPTGLTYVPGSATVSDANGMTINGLSASLVGQVLTISASSVVNPGNVDNAAAADSDAFVIGYQALVADIPAVVNGTVLTNSVNASADSVAPDNNNAASLTVVEPALQLTKTLLTSSAGVDAADTVQYQIRVSPTAGSTADAFSIDLSDDMPAGLQNSMIISALITDGVNSFNVASNFTINGAGDLVTLAPPNLLLNTNGSNDQVLTIVVRGTVRDAINPGATIANAATATWRNVTGTQRANYTSTNLAPTITIPQALSVSKSIVTPSTGPVNSGDVVTYRLVTVLIEGTTQNLRWVDTLPAGMSYVPGSLTISDSNGDGHQWPECLSRWPGPDDRSIERGKLRQCR